MAGLQQTYLFFLYWDTHTWSGFKGLGLITQANENISENKKNKRVGIL